MPVEEANQYSDVKKAILHRLDLPDISVPCVCACAGPYIRVGH
jgi:hypothetical protein